MALELPGSKCRALLASFSASSKRIKCKYACTTKAGDVFLHERAFVDAPVKLSWVPYSSAVHLPWLRRRGTQKWFLSRAKRPLNWITSIIRHSRNTTPTPTKMPIVVHLIRWSEASTLTQINLDAFKFSPAIDCSMSRRPMVVLRVPSSRVLQRHTFDQPTSSCCPPVVAGRTFVFLISGQDSS